MLQIRSKTVNNEVFLFCFVVVVVVVVVVLFCLYPLIRRVFLEGKFTWNVSTNDVLLL